MYSNEEMLGIRDEIVRVLSPDDPPRFLTLTSLLDEVGGDSLDLVEFIMKLEEENALDAFVLRGLPLQEIIELLIRRRL